MANHHSIPASMTPPASADGEKPSPLDNVHHSHPHIHANKDQHQHTHLTSPQMSELDLDSTMASEAAGAGVPPVEDIEPDHYYGGGKIPVFKPTMDQFRDFQLFIQKVDKYGMKSGVVKVIPPQEWVDSLPELDDAIKSIRVKNPIMQEFHGSHGTFTQANIEKQRSYNLPQWKGVCDEPSHQPPARRGERRRNLERPATRAAKATRSDSQKRKPGPKPKVEQDEDIPDNRSDGSKPEGPPTPVSPESMPVETKTEELSDGESLHAVKPKGRQPKSVTSRRKYNRGEAADHVDEEAFKDFDYHLANVEEFTPERCEELETGYWKSLMYNNPMYGADMPGSLFDDTVTSWNVAKLPNLLDVLGSKVPGVNTAYLYLGMWKATFAWHLEDVDLYSINYIHFGAPKQWYSISQEDLPKFEAAMKSMWPADAKHCDQFLRHKTYLISPSLLKSQYGITVNKMVHYEKEFVITYPYGYHSGFNLGYNCAESVNFATEKWLDYARVAKKCNCEADSVWIDIGEIERKLRGESTPEYYDEGSDDHLDGVSDLLTPPRSVPEKSGNRVKKRKQDGKESKSKRAKLHVEGPRKIPCVLCPNNLDYEDLLPTEDGLSHAHRRCALYIEETSILRDESGKEVVCDVDKIPKARMGLKCLFCREVRGACFQCMHGKCARAYHPTCALLAGVQVEFGELAVVAADGREYTVPGVDLKCKYHRPKRYGSPSADSRYTDSRRIETAKKLRVGDLLQFQADKEINGGVVLQNRLSEQALLVKVLPRGDVIELPYKWVLIVTKSNFLPLSAGIQPLPSHLARKPESRKDLASSLPSHGTPFGEANSIYQWAEFACMKPPHNAETVRPDLFKPGSLWFYLGNLSTECRPHYTDDPARPIHNPRSNFLDSVKSQRVPTMPALHHAYQRPNPAVHHVPGPAGPWMHGVQRPQMRPVMPPTLHTQHMQRPTPPASTVVSQRMPQAVSHAHPAPQQVTAPQANNKIPAWTPGDNKTAQHMMVRRLVASITEHANHCAGYNIVDPDFVVQTLLGPIGAEAPKSGMDKLRKAMSESYVQPKRVNGFLPPQQPLNIQADEVDHLLRMLRFAILNLTNKRDQAKLKPTEQVKKPVVKEPRDLFPNPKGWAYLEIQKRQSSAVYRSPYAPGFGFSEYAKQEYGLTDVLRPARKQSLAADFFARLSPEDQEKVVQACPNAAPPSKKGMGMDDPVDPVMVLDDSRVTDYNQQPTTTVSMEAMDVDDNHLSVFDMTLQADSPASSFSRMQFQYQSPQDFSSHIEHESAILPRHLHDHHDLFGDQQANTRFWQRSVPWATDGENQSQHDDDSHRPFFGPHLPDYAASDMDIERGPGSLHSMDMAGFGFDGPEDLLD